MAERDVTAPNTITATRMVVSTPSRDASTVTAGDERLLLQSPRFPCVIPRDSHPRDVAAQVGSTPLGCGTTEAQLGRDAAARNDVEAANARYGAALAVLERVRNAQGLALSPFSLDSRCFGPLANEPGYQSLVAHLEGRQKTLRERLPATLIEYEVADVRP